jgi:hypothetical protein
VGLTAIGASANDRRSAYQIDGAVQPVFEAAPKQDGGEVQIPHNFAVACLEAAPVVDGNARLAEE